MKNLTRILLKAGYIPLFWSLIWTTFGTMLTPDYNWLGQHVSELALAGGNAELIEKICGLGTGLAFIAFAFGLWMESDRDLAVGALLWIIFGVAMISNGIWRIGSPMHGLYAIGIVNLVAPALACLDSARLRNNRTALNLTAFCSMAGVIYLWLNMMGMDPQDYHGLTQRLFSMINSLWPLGIALILLRDQSNHQTAP